VAAPRVLILSASIGEGHDLPARVIADGLRALRPGIHVRIEDGLLAMGWPVDRIVLGGARPDSRAAKLFFDASYWLYTQVAPARHLGGWLLERLGGPRLLALIAAERPDVVVATYPGVSEALGRLRRGGRLRVPVASAITDLAGLYYWAHPGVDLHLVIHRESIEEVRAIAPASRIVWASGMTDPDFLVPRDRGEARRALDLPVDGPVIVVSGGGWAMGDLEGAAEVSLRVEGATVVCLCGRSEEVRARLAARFAGESRLRTVGFTDRMGDWLAAADALIHSTVGLTVLEAIIRGCPVISYGWGLGHIRANNRAYRRFGLADVATTHAELDAALRRAIAHRPQPDLSLTRIPSAAAEILATAGR
jgi:processive 1,2-diacylglycerol beta-glucosyltransferase